MVRAAMIDSGLQIRETDAGLEIRVHVQPRARRFEVSGLYDGALKLKVTAPPVDDAANRAVVEYLADRLEIPRSRLRIAAGARSRNKTLLVERLSREDLEKRLSRIL